MSDVRTAIVLQGGGALGAYEYGVLKALYEARPGFRPEVVTGISIGAITAAVLGGAHRPIDALGALWQDHLTTLPGTEALGNPGMYAIDPAVFWPPWTATAMYSTAPLRRTLAELVDLELLNDPAIRVAVGATDIETGLMRYFDNHTDELTFEHVAASGALPPGFPAVHIEGQSYWDGGLFSNLPLAPAINALEQAAGGDPDVARELIVVELFDMAGELPRSISGVLQRMVELQYTSRLQIDAGFFGKISDVVDVLAQVDKDLPDNAAVRSDPTYQKLRRHRRIDHFHVVTAHLPARWAKANDFSRDAIEARIEAGYADAVASGIGTPALAVL